MNEITEKDVKKVWVEKDAICVDLDGVWFDDLDEGLALSGFFSPKKTNPVGHQLMEV